VLVGRRRHREGPDRELLWLVGLGQCVEHVGIVGAAEGLKPPDAVGETEYAIVERHTGVRLWDGTVGRRRKPLDDVPELVAPRADPATAEHPGLRDGRQVDVVERVAVEDAHGVEGDERLAVVPVADQRDEAVATAEAT